MVNSRSELTLSLLLFSALCLEAFIIELEVYSPAQRPDCTARGTTQVWMGLRRVPLNDSAWRWIDPKGGEGVSGGDFSQRVLWADGEQSDHCALVDADLKWHSIGLHRKAGETWSWIGDQQSDFRNWAQGEPFYADCGSFDPVNQKFHSKACSTELPFLCYDDNLVVVNENKTWEDALKHCRKMESPSFKVWTSLRFLGGEWRWSNGQQLEDQSQTMLPDCPSQWKHCGTLSKHDTNHWITRNCLERRNFICYRYKTVSNQTDYLGV
ncbi:hypothetical protein KUCAC02_013668 [Chaenocephalus aceratus]|uniref:Uncharacterized protein n=1 Tax=Chaenocephalus aceratus TaxID=36190 RepID=A0ACB9WCF5_CHAAC|nr:hypothetical protein KUCAC02_013668 [Chaenocephalus aceratus]